MKWNPLASFTCVLSSVAFSIPAMRNTLSIAVKGGYYAFTRGCLWLRRVRTLMSRRVENV